MGADKHAHSSETDRKGAATKFTGYFLHYTPYLIAVLEAENDDNNNKTKKTQLYVLSAQLGECNNDSEWRFPKAFTSQTFYKIRAVFEEGKKMQIHRSVISN